MSPDLALLGGSPIRSDLLPYGRQQVDPEEVESVIQVLRSDYLTTGPMIEAFEQAFCDNVGASFAVAVSSGTAALHAAVHALNVQPSEEVIVPSMTFASTANCVVFEGAIPVFADVDPMTLLIDPLDVAERINARTRAIITVDYAGQPCDYSRLSKIAARNGLTIIADACHSMGATFEKRKVGSLATLNAFSLHPVKHITTGEGGLITTENHELAARMRRFRNHGIDRDHQQRSETGSWFYQMIDLGYNYRLTDFQSALGISQLGKLEQGLDRRRRIAREYDLAFAELQGVSPLAIKPNRSHAYHLYVIQLDTEKLSCDRSQIYTALRAEGIGVNVHYIPVHLHPYYRENFSTKAGQCPNAERAYQRILSLPIFPSMTRRDVKDVIAAVEKVIGAYQIQ
jgi:perosamine synthetase